MMILTGCQEAMVNGVDVRIAMDVISLAWRSAYRGIDGIEWIRIHRATDDAFLDPRDYRSKMPLAKGGKP